MGLITHQGEPVGIAGLSKCQQHWEPVTQWLLPGSVFPIREDYLPQALDQLNLDLWVGFWRPHQPPVYTKNVRYLEATPTHRMSCSANPEEFWRETGKFKAIRACRNRCKDFTYGINLPGAAEWTIRNWSARWGREGEELNLSDRLLIARYLENLGMHYTLSILDQGEFIAGATMTVHGKDLVAGVNYRVPEYDWHGIGDRLLDLVFSWAAESNYRTFDLGGGQEYKTKWAPQEGERWTGNICPGHIYHTKRIAHWLRGGLKRAP